MSQNCKNPPPVQSTCAILYIYIGIPDVKFFEQKLKDKINKLSLTIVMQLKTIVWECHSTVGFPINAFGGCLSAGVIDSKSIQFSCAFLDCAR